MTTQLRSWAADATLRDSLLELLGRVRARTRLLMEPLSDDDARVQHDPLMSPIVWDLGHIAAFERLWLDAQLDSEVMFGDMPGTFNPFENPRRTRGQLRLPSLAEALAHLDGVRARTLERIQDVRFNSTPMLTDGYVYRMVAQHEAQHQETILQTLQLKTGMPYQAPCEWRVAEPAITVDDAKMVSFPGGEVEIGTDDRSSAYDNERPRHTVRLAPFDIDVAPVTNARFAEFVEDGGYDDRRLWTEPGWSWREESGARAPKHWERRDGVWTTRVMDRDQTVDPRRPVCHVCFHEAAAFATWAGTRLPTEFEWETAATWNPNGQRRSYPWGEESLTPTVANVDQLAFEPAPVGAYPANVSPMGCYGMIGDVWEWTSSDFAGYPGFEAFPYAEYSQAFFGAEYKVLRGGSWATAPHVARSTFRNWDFPIRRQIFAGFRCARDA